MDFSDILKSQKTRTKGCTDGMEMDFAGAHMIWGSVIRCTADDAAAYYKADARRVLTLFVTAAEQSLELSADTLMAAVAAAPGVNGLPGRIAGDAAQRLLLSGAPEALGVLCAAGAYETFGLPRFAPCLHGMASVPATPMTRWWRYLRLCGVRARQDAAVCAALERDAGLPDLLAAMDALAARKAPPDGTQALKQTLSRLPESLDYDAAARTLAAEDPRWNGQCALYAALRASREPYLVSHLAVTSAELTAAHIRGSRQMRVMRGLLDAVIAAPQVNFPEALMALAHTLAAQDKS